MHHYFWLSSVLLWAPNISNANMLWKHVPRKWFVKIRVHIALKARCQQVVKSFANTFVLRSKSLHGLMSWIIAMCVCQWKLAVKGIVICWQVRSDNFTVLHIAVFKCHPFTSNISWRLNNANCQWTTYKNVSLWQLKKQCWSNLSKVHCAQCKYCHLKNVLHQIKMWSSEAYDSVIRW